MFLPVSCVHFLAYCRAAGRRNPRFRSLNCDRILLWSGHPVIMCFAEVQPEDESCVPWHNKIFCPRKLHCKQRAVRCILIVTALYSVLSFFQYRASVSRDILPLFYVDSQVPYACLHRMWFTFIGIVMFMLVFLGFRGGKRSRFGLAGHARLRTAWHLYCNRIITECLHMYPRINCYYS